MATNRRTPEQAAAYYQAKANRARAIAVKQKRNEETRQLMRLGSTMLEMLAKRVCGAERPRRDAVLQTFWNGIGGTLEGDQREFCREYLANKFECEIVDDGAISDEADFAKFVEFLSERAPDGANTEEGGAAAVSPKRRKRAKRSARSDAGKAIAGSLTAS